MELLKQQEDPFLQGKPPASGNLSSTTSAIAAESQITSSPQKRAEKCDDVDEEPVIKFVKCSFPLNGDFVATGSSSSNKETLELPEEIVSNPEIFREILSKKTWDDRLNDDHRNHLSKLLPENVQTSTKEELDGFLSKLFDPSSSLPGFRYLSHPLLEFQRKLNDGYYDDICSSEVRQLKDCAKLHYEYRIREYYGRVLKKLLICRRKLLEAAASVSEGTPFSYDWKSDLVSTSRTIKSHVGEKGTTDSLTWIRAQKRAKLMIMDCKTRAGEHTLLPSSDDEDYVVEGTTSAGPGASTRNVSGHNAGQQHHHRQADPSTGRASSSSSSSVQSTLAKPNSVDLDLHEPSENADIKDLLKEYRYLRRVRPEHPSLEFDDIDLDDVIDRCDVETKQFAQKYGVYKKQQEQEAAFTTEAGRIYLLAPAGAAPPAPLLPVGGGGKKSTAASTKHPHSKPAAAVTVTMTTK